METRKITIINTKTQSTKVIETGAETLAELKEALDVNNVDYTDMTFYEGLSQVELLSDETRLPHDVLYKGITTNDLVIMMTNMKSKITSGVSEDNLKTITDWLGKFINAELKDCGHICSQDEDSSEEDEEYDNECEEDYDEDYNEKSKENEDVDETKVFTVRKLQEVKQILDEIIARTESEQEVDKSAYTSKELKALQARLGL